LEVDGAAHFDGLTTFYDAATMTTGSTRLKLVDNIDLAFGNSVDAALSYNTAQTPDTMVFGLPATGNSLLLVEFLDVDFDFGHSLQPDPTLIGHSANQATDEWWSLAHDQTNPVLGVGKGNLRLESGIYLLEGTAPTPIAGYGSLHTTNANDLIFTDGGGTTHVIGGAGVVAHSSLWYHGIEVTTGIATVSTFVTLGLFENVGLEDPDGSAVGDPATGNDITIATGAGGGYKVNLQASFRNASGANKSIIIVPCVQLATPPAITGATAATPIVITSTAHGFKDGDMLTLSGVGGVSEANGDFTVSNESANTFELETLAHVDVAGTGGYTSGGTIDTHCLGAATVEGVVSGNDLSRGAAHGDVTLADGDTVDVAVANTSDNNDLIISQIRFSVERFTE